MRHPASYGGRALGPVQVLRGSGLPHGFRHLWAERLDGSFPPMDIGQAVFLCYGRMTAAMLMTAAFVMSLSEVAKSGIDTLPAVEGMSLRSRFRAERYWVLSRQWSYFPSGIVGVISSSPEPCHRLAHSSCLGRQPRGSASLGFGFRLIGRRASVGYQVSGR